MSTDLERLQKQADAAFDSLMEAEHAFIDAAEDFLTSGRCEDCFRKAYDGFAEARGAWCDADEALENCKGTKPVNAPGSPSVN